jgi:hypothetical protein
MPKMSKMLFTQGSPYSDPFISLLQVNLTLKCLTDTFAARGNISASLGNTSGTWWVSRNPGFQIRMLKTGFLNRIIPTTASAAFHIFHYNSQWKMPGKYLGVFT